VEYVFSQFALNYGHGWTSQMANPEWTKALKRQWYEQLQKMKLEDIHAALKFLASSENTEYRKFPPNVLEFQSLPLKAKEKNIPSELDCYHAAIRSEWNFHPIIKPAAQACDVFWLQKQASDVEGRRRFSGYYASFKEKYLRGIPLEVQKALPEMKSQQIYPKKLTAAEKNQQEIEAILSMPGAREKLREAKTAKEKRKIYPMLKIEYAAANENKTI